jgi:hypothetical protein
MFAAPLVRAAGGGETGEKSSLTTDTTSWQEAHLDRAFREANAVSANAKKVPSMIEQWQ